MIEPPGSDAAPVDPTGASPMDSDEVRVLMMLGPLDDALTLKWIGPMPRWRARDVLRDFGSGIEWEGRPVVRALILG